MRRASENKESREKVCKRSRGLNVAIEKITGETIKTLKPFTFPERLDRSMNPDKHSAACKKQISNCVTELVFLHLRMRLSSTQYLFGHPKTGDIVNERTMKCSWINCNDGMREKEEPKHVAITVFPSLWKRDDSASLCLIEAKVIPKRGSAQIPTPVTDAKKRGVSSLCRR